MSGHGWIGVDLDGTLAHYEKWMGVDVIGAPVPRMLARVKRWIDEGRDVRIFTARVAGRGLTDDHADERRRAIIAIDKWCIKHLGVPLPVTHEKDFGMIELWDDRAVTVEENTGRALSRSRRGLDLNEYGELD